MLSKAVDKSSDVNKDEPQGPGQGPNPQGQGPVPDLQGLTSSHLQELE